MNRARRPPLQHPLAQYFEQAIDSLGTALHPETVRHYRGTARNFLTWLEANYPDIRSLDQLQRNPHVLGWLAHLHSQSTPLATASCINLLIHMRGIFHELAWTEHLSELAHLLRREDVPRMPQPKVIPGYGRFGLNGVSDSVLGTQHVLEMFRRTLPDNAVRRSLGRLSNRLTKMLAELRRLNTK